MAIDDNNTLFVAYQDFPQSSKATVQKYQDVVSSIDAEEYSSKENGIYPNPTSDKLFVSKKSENTAFTIFNSLGAELEKGIISGNSINVSQLDNGVYYLQLSGNDKISRMKFIKQ